MFKKNSLTNELDPIEATLTELATCFPYAAKKEMISKLSTLCTKYQISENKLNAFCEYWEINGTKFPIFQEIFNFCRKNNKKIDININDSYKCKNRLCSGNGMIELKTQYGNTLSNCGCRPKKNFLQDFNKLRDLEYVTESQLGIINSYESGNHKVKNMDYTESQLTDLAVEKLCLTQ